MIFLSHSICDFLGSLTAAFFFFFFEILGSTQILGFMRQPPCLGLLRGSCPTLVGCGSSGSSAFPAPVMLLDVFGLSHEIRTPAGL